MLIIAKKYLVLLNMVYNVCTCPNYQKRLNDIPVLRVKPVPRAAVAYGRQLKIFRYLLSIYHNICTYIGKYLYTDFMTSV